MHICKEKLGCTGENITLYSKDVNLEFEICNDCGIIWRSNVSRSISKVYEQNYFDSKKYGKKRIHKIKKSGWLIDLVQSKGSAICNLLEVGCSLGYTLEAAKNRGIHHLGIDISKYAIEFCSSIGLNAEQLSFSELKNRDEKFDLIFMQHVLEHFNDPFIALQYCSDLLYDNGKILILVPNSKYKRAVKLNSKHRFYSLAGVGAEHYVYFNYDNLIAVLEASGFKMLQINYPAFLKNHDSIEFFVNRIFRRMLSFFQSDQELIVLAEKVRS